MQYGQRSGDRHLAPGHDLEASVPIDKAETWSEPGFELRVHVSILDNPDSAVTDVLLKYSAWAVAVARWAIGVYNMQNYDRPWWAGISFTLSILEINTGLICACATTLGPLWKVAYAKARGYSSRGDSEASSWPSKYRRSDVFIKNKAPNRLSYIQRHRDGPLEKSDVLLTPPRRVRRDDTLFSNGDEEYGLIDFSDPHAVDSVGDVERGNRTI